MTVPDSSAPVAAFPHRHVPIARAGGPRQAIPLELAAPLALGQRGLVVGAPRTGATTVLRWLGGALVDAVEDLELRVLLVDRPVEEHLEWREELPGALVVGALARALAATHDHSDGRVLDGGMPQTALMELRSWFGMARTGEPGDPSAGTLTILATVLLDTAQQLDEVILHELVGTGNVEWRLDAETMRTGLFPPVDILGSGARRTELIIGEHEADRRALLRAKVDEQGLTAGLGLLIDQIDEYGTLAAVLDDVAGP
jgi:transcription termination factor Rho